MAARSDAGNAEGESKRRRVSGADVIANQIETVVADLRSSDKAFLRSEIDCLDGKDLTTLTALWRTGAIKSFLATQRLFDQQGSLRGKFILTKIKTFKQLECDELNEILQEFEEVFKMDGVLGDLSLDEKRDLVCFGLGLTRHAAVPTHDYGGFRHIFGSRQIWKF